MIKQKIKDWVLSENMDNINLISYTWRKGDKYTYCSVHKTGLPLKEMKRRGKIGTYIFNARIGLNGELQKEYFKTKNEALEYAYKFMEN